MINYSAFDLGAAPVVGVTLIRKVINVKRFGRGENVKRDILTSVMYLQHHRYLFNLHRNISM